ncbi:MAG: TIGR00341 family protein [Raineya sp.]
MLKYLKIFDEQEDYEIIVDTITKGVVFSGTNLLVLVFAIVVASVGLNVNSTAVIIGAMLISPLMGPIMGIGLGIGTYDFGLIRLSLKNLAFAVGVSLLASTIYFLISPLNEAHSELFARTSPNIYDVMIAFFGGLAGITAIISKQKGNALPGAAIATALMPPLCTAGFGIATQQWRFFFGAFYLFLINSVFISLATYAAVRLLKFPTHEINNSRLERFLKRAIVIVTLLTLLPSIYLGYRLIQAEKFNIKAKKFIEGEFNFENSFVFEKKIDFASKEIRLTIGGKSIEKEEIEKLKAKMKTYGLEDTEIIIKNTLSLKLENNTKEEKINFIIKQKQQTIDTLKKERDSIQKSQELYKSVAEEVLLQYPELKSASISLFVLKKTDKKLHYLNIETKQLFPKGKLDILKKWLKKRLDTDSVEVFVRL